MNAEQWTAEWPTKSGDYWFYGHVHKCGYRSPPEIFLVSTYLYANGGLSYITEGMCLLKLEGAKGMWLPAHLPEPPEPKGEQ